MSITVIICAYTMERLDDVISAVRSVLDQTLKPVEIILSIDHNQELFDILKGLNLSPMVKIVLNEGINGLSETRNVGIRTASGDLVAFLDDDAVAEPDWLENLIKPFTDLNVKVVGGKAIPKWPDNKRPVWFPEELDWIVGCTYKGLPVNGGETRNVIGCNMIFKKDIFNLAGFWGTQIGAVGGQGLKGGEEAELCLRIKGAIPEARIIFKPEAVIRHTVPRWRATVKWVVQHAYAEGVCKAKVKKLTTGISNNTLNTENSYLTYLLFHSIPQRILHFYRKGSIRQIIVIGLGIIATGFGYVIGRRKGLIQ